MSKSIKKLWEVQLRMWPNSVRMTPSDMYAWCKAAYTPQSELYRYQQIAMALHHPVHVFYRIEGTDYMGIRYGLQAHEYLCLYAG